MNQTLQPPIRIFLDIASPIVSKGEGTLLWTLGNVSDEYFDEIRIEAAVSNPKQTIHPVALHRFSLGPSQRCDLAQATDLTQSDADHLVFQLILEARARSGRQYAMALTNLVPLRNIPERGQKRKLTLAGKNIVLDEADLSGFQEVEIRPTEAAFMGDTQLNASGDVVIEGDGKITVTNSGNPRSDRPRGAPQPQAAFHQSTLENIREIVGFHVTITEPQPPANDGLAPLCLETFTRAWPHDRNNVTLLFVDDHKQARGGQAVTQNDIDYADTYKLFVQARRAGHLTLIVQGTSGNYYLAAPNQVGESKVAAGSSHFFPGTLMALPNPAFPEMLRLAFADTGTERAIALLTSTPLLKTMPPLSRIVPEVVVHLLAQARKMPEASIAYTDVVVTRPQNAWSV